MSDDDMAFVDSDDDFQDSTPVSAPVKKVASQESKQKPKKKKATPSKRKLQKSSQGTPAKKAKKTSRKSSATKQKAKPKVATVGEHEGKRLLLDYMQQQNRPYSHTQVFDNLHGRIKKSQIPRILEALELEGKLTMKAFKKTKLYFVNQSIFPAVSQERLREMQTEAKQLMDSKQTHTQEVATIKAELSRILSSPENSQLDALIAPLEAKVAEKTAKLNTILGSGRRLVTEADKKRLQSQFNTYYLEWKKRKKGVQEMVSEYCDNAGKKPKQFMEQVGVELDEDYNQSLDKWTPLYKK